ncbi:MAG: hypothetical protein WCX88_00210 [Patescibacteria group bacterium]
MKTKIFLSLGFISLAIFLFSNIARATEFNPNYIISDEDLTKKDTMSVDSIQSFLESKGSYLANYSDLDFYGKTEKASTIIYNAAQDYNINPQAILVMLQKEQSLVENESPKQYNLDWAMGWQRPDGSDPNDPNLQKRKGFGIQVDGAAGLLEWYMDNHDLPTYYLKKAGVTYNIDDTEVTPETKATAALYNYTPHLHGNSNFQTIWERYFSKNYLNGSLVQVENEGGVWLLQNGQRRAFASRSALVSRYDLDLVIPISKTDLEKYPVGKEIKFAQYSLLRIPSGGVYMIDGDYKRPITSQEALKMIGYNPEEIEDVSSDDLFDYPTGEPITVESVYPTGALLQDTKTGAVFSVVDGKKYGIIDRSILKLKFPKAHIIPAAVGELDKYQPAGFVKFNDGELVSPVENKTVYVIADGLKRPIVSGEVFETLGYKWKNIIKVPASVLDKLHDTGEVVEINS